MITSMLVRRKNEFEEELRRGTADPKRRQYILARLRQIQNDIGALGLSETEIKTNEIQTGHDKDVTVGNRQVFIPPASWVEFKEQPEVPHGTTSRYDQGCRCVNSQPSRHCNSA